MKNKLTDDFKIAVSVLTERGHLSRKHMVAAGLTDAKISSMKKSGLLRSLDRGEYAVANMEALLERADELFAMDEIEKALICYKICADSEPQNPHIASKGLCASCRKRDYKNLENYLDALSVINDAQSQANFNLYLRMLSLLCVVPEKYINRAQEMDEFAVLPLESDVLKGSLTDLKSFLNAIETQDYQSAYILMEKIGRENPASVDVLTTKSLALDLKEHNKNFLKSINICTQSRAFDQSLILLEREEHYHELKTSMVLLKMVLEDIAEMKKSGIPLEPQHCTSQRQYDLVYTRHYDKMLQKHLAFIKKKFIDPSTNALAIALEEAISLRDRLLRKTPVETKPVEAEPVKPAQKSKPGEDHLTNMFLALINDQNDEAMRQLDDFLKERELTRYDYIIKGWIKTCQIEGDVGFVRPMMTICQMTSGDYKVDTADLIASIDYRLENDSLETARILLDMLAKASENGDADVEPAALAGSLLELQNRVAFRTFKSQKRGKGGKKMTTIKGSTL